MPPLRGSMDVLTKPRADALGCAATPLRGSGPVVCEDDGLGPSGAFRYVVRPAVRGKQKARPMGVVDYVCRACATAWKWKSSPNLMEVKGSGAQGRRREAGSEGSAEQKREPMNKNRIRGASAGRASV